MGAGKGPVLWRGGNDPGNVGNLTTARIIVSPARIERATYSLEGCCSIHLSYGPKRPALLPDNLTYADWRIAERRKYTIIDAFMQLPEALQNCRFLGIFG